MSSNGASTWWRNSSPSAPVDQTRYSLSCNPDLTLDLLACRERGQCDFLFAGQLNSELPFMPGDADISAEQLDMMLEGPQTDFPLFAPPRQPVDLADYAAGLHVARTVADGGTLQLGIGSFGDAVAQSLIVRHRYSHDFRTILARLDPAGRAPAGLRQEAPFEAGLHGVSEMFVEGFLDLMQAGILKREVDGALLNAAFFVGSRAFYRTLREMPQAELAKLRMTSVSYVNQLYGDEAAKRRARVEGALHQQCHAGDLARRRGVGRAGRRPGRERRRRPVQLRRAKLRARGRALHHHAARDPREQAGAPPRTSAGTMATPPFRAICAISS